MKILVTGASGFIGSHLVESLIAQKHTVHSFVKNKSNISNIEHVATNIKYGDIKDLNSLKEATKNIDEVYHLAAIPNWQGGISKQEYEDVNVTGTHNVLEACRLNHVKKFLFTSSLEATGPSCNGKPVDEKTLPEPGNIYGETKLTAEKMIAKYNKKHCMKTVIVRLPAVYGPRNILHLKRYFKMVKKSWYPIVGNGESLMEFCFVKNAVLGLTLAMKKGRNNEIYFISDERSYKFIEVINTIAKQLNVKVKFLNMPVFFAKALGFSCEILSKFLKFYPFYFKEMGRPVFSRKSVDWMAKNTLFCDITKSKNELGYHAPFALSDGIKETTDWYKKIKVL
uniref:Nucleoside-diphosphate-sugar epimerases n=1 Tax=uncultured verrucomicrobium HF0500_08N17 TaxID=723597 RepID=E7C4Y4_9BACT|nr:nucleoside-diphosphate-sugar epimerases [uncultured verrucomicrobium HF0500_08N17]